MTYRCKVTVVSTSPAIAERGYATVGYERKTKIVGLLTAQSVAVKVHWKKNPWFCCLQSATEM